MAIKICRW